MLKPEVGCARGDLLDEARGPPGVFGDLDEQEEHRREDRRNQESEEQSERQPEDVDAIALSEDRARDAKLCRDGRDGIGRGDAQRSARDDEQYCGDQDEYFRRLMNIVRMIRRKKQNNDKKHRKAGGECQHDSDSVALTARPLWLES